MANLRPLAVNGDDVAKFEDIGVEWDHILMALSDVNAQAFPGLAVCESRGSA